MKRKTTQKPVYIIDGMRTPIGNPFKSLKDFTASELAALAIKGLIKKAQLSKKDIDDVILGHTVSAGTGQNIARHTSGMAGLTKETSAYVVDNVCGSALQAVEIAACFIASQRAQCLIVGGAESATHSPFLISREDAYGNRVRKSIDSLFVDGLYCPNARKSMGELAENMVKRHKLFREDMDIYAYESNQKAIEAQEKKFFRNEIVPIKIAAKKILDRDDRPRKNLRLESLWQLAAAFKEKGLITAGNASVPCDGAAVLALASQKYLRKHRLKAKAKILGITKLSVNPNFVFESTGAAISQCLKESGLTLGQIDAFEIGESFAAQMVLLQQTLKIPPQRVNMFGGDLALGHPLGTSGARNLVTLINVLHQKRLKNGLVCVSFGGGGSFAIVIQAVLR